MHTFRASATTSRPRRGPGFLGDRRLYAGLLRLRSGSLGPAARLYAGPLRLLGLRRSFPTSTIDNELSENADEDDRPEPSPTMKNPQWRTWWPPTPNIILLLPVLRPSPSRQSPTRPSSISKTRSHIPTCAFLHVPFCQCCIVEACFELSTSINSQRSP